jgi:LacI family transcriptional regulator
VVNRPTIADLAQAAGVSVATVDRVLNRRLPVSADTAQRVVQAAEAIGYHATGLLKRRLIETPTRRFGFLLQKREDVFYSAFGQELARATASSKEVNGKAWVDFSEELVPRTIAARQEAMAEKCDAIAIVAVDHPHVGDAIERVTRKGKPVFTLLSDVAQSARKAYLAVDSRKSGRTAAWTIARMADRPGKVGILVGSHRYLSQDLAEISFRSYLREHAPDLQLLESHIILDDSRIAYEAVVQMLQTSPDLVGIYDCGGGREGLVSALRDENAAERVVSVCNELTITTKAALIDGVLDMVLATPIGVLSAQTVAYMTAACEGSGDIPDQTLVPADMFISENI